MTNFAGGNKAVVKFNGATLYCLHETVLVAVHSDGAIQLNTGGWDTKTTWKWMGIALGSVYPRVEFTKFKGERRVVFRGESHSYKDGMILGRVPLADMDITVIDNDVGGSKRMVVWYGNLLTDKERADHVGNITSQLHIALARAKQVSPNSGKYRSKKYGGGVVFGENWDDDQLRRKIAKAISDAEALER